jgi:hypothetical protein
MPWVELDGDLAEALEAFSTAADRRIAEGNAEKRIVVLAESADEVGSSADHDEARHSRDFAAMMRAQDVPLVRSAAEAETFRELMHRPARPRRQLPSPLPLDE